MRAPMRSAVRFLAYAAAGLIAAVLGLALALPLLVDQPRVHAELERRLSAAIRGTLAWDALHVRLMPAPHGVLEGLRLEIPQLLQARAARLEVRLRFWPLLRGRVEISSLTAVGAAVRLEPVATQAAAPVDRQAPDPIAVYRAAADGARRALQAFAPDTELAIEEGAMELRLAGLPPVALKALSLRAQSDGARAEVQMTASSTWWRRLQLSGNLEYATLAARARIDVAELDPQAVVAGLLQQTGWQLAAAPLALRATLEADKGEALAGRVEASTRAMRLRQGQREWQLPEVAFKADVRSDAARAEARIEELQLEGRKLLHGTAHYGYASRDASVRAEFDVDAAHALGVARRALAPGAAAGLDEVESASGRLRGSAFAVRQEGHWRAGLQLHESDAAVRLRALPLPVQLHTGGAEWQPGRLSVSALRASLGRSSVAQGAARLRLDKEARLESASGKAQLDLGELFPWARDQPALADALRDIKSVAGGLEAELGKASGRLVAPDFELRLLPRGVRIQAAGLPGELSVDGGAARVTRTTAQLEQVGLAVLDARAMLSGSATGLGKPDFRVRGSLAGGSAGPQSVAWVLERAKAPPQLALRTPFAFAAEQLDWGPGRQLEARAHVRFDDQTAVAAELAWRPALLDLRRLEVRDTHGTSALNLRAEAKHVEGRFSGTMHGAVLAYFLKEAQRYTGRISGDLRFEADTDRLNHGTLEGRLGGEGVDLSWLAGRPLVIEKFAIEAGRAAVRIGEAVVRSGKEAASLRGELRRGAEGPVVDATIETEGLVLDEWLPAAYKAGGAPAADPSPRAPEAKPAAALSPEASADEELRRWWPLPVTGRLALRAGYLQRGHLRIAPVVLALVLDAERAHLEVEQAQLCGISFPFTLEARPEAWAAAVRIAAQRQPVSEMMRCLTGEHVQITGQADLAVELQAQGQARDLLRNLQGSGRFEARDGQIQKFALVGNILSLLDIQDTAEAAKDLAEGKRAFRYRRIAAHGRLRGGLFKLEEGTFESPSAGMAANGTIRLADGDTQMTVLVAPFGRVDRLVRGIPIVGYVIGGTLTSIPVGVSGDIRSPLVVPLGPRAVTQELLGIFERTVTLPGKLAEPPTK